MTWYLVVAGVIVYLIIGIFVCLLCKRIGEFSDALNLDSPLPMAGVACIWPFILICIVVYFFMILLAVIIYWLDQILGGKKSDN